MTESKQPIEKDCVRFCGWGHVLFAQTFDDPKVLVEHMLAERSGERDIAAYVEHPHIVLAHAPQKLFLDPSDMLRLRLGTQKAPGLHDNIEIRRISDQTEARCINDLYLKRDMVPSDYPFIWEQRDSAEIVFLVAVDTSSNQVVGTVTGLDHTQIFGDPDNGCSLWCLAVDPGALQPGIGEALVRQLALHFQNVGRDHMDLSVIFDNRQAKALYEKLGFKPIRVFSIKTKNAHNEALFLGPALEERLNPYARIIVDEARARGIWAEVLDEAEGYFRLSRGGRSIICRESLSELTSAVAMSRCQDKYVTHRWLSKAGLRTPGFQLAGSEADNAEFLERFGRIVIKPTTGEQGKGITVGVTDTAAMNRAIDLARQYSERVLLESFQPGEDLRVIVIGGEVVAAAVRRPARIVGDGKTPARTLIEKQSRRRQAATHGESNIPIDDETKASLKEHGFDLDSIVPAGETVSVRRTANLHTGGTIHDVTDRLHPHLVEISRQAAQRLGIPVVGLDLMVSAPEKAEYVIIEANERPGLANHEPQPTAQRFVDLLFPLSLPTAGGSGARRRSHEADA